MLRVRQHFEAPRVADVAQAVRRELARLRIGETIRPGQSVAVTAGSRGIANIALVIRTVIEVLRDLGAVPFIVPAMGSHGGGTAEGQRAILEGYGITEASAGAPIRSSMEVVCLGETEDGVPVWFDREAAAADHVVIVNRVKPHTTFSAEIESGLAKMLVIGLGKQVGASVYHRAIVERSFSRVLASAAHVLRERARVAFGLALVENASDETAAIEAVRPAELEAREKALLVLAKRWMPRLPVAAADLLVVEEMGKNVSGSGMDTNVIGRKPEGDGRGAPRIRRVFVRALTPETRGNAYGIGFADFTTTRLVAAMDYRATVLNCLTAAHPEAGLIPLHFATDREAVDAALASAGLGSAEHARVVRIQNTRRLAELEVSEACREEVATRGDIDVRAPARELAFDEAGNLLPLGAGW